MEALCYDLRAAGEVFAHRILTLDACNSSNALGKVDAA
jgi:hypothetical protein